MPYILRDANGEIASLHRADPGGGEWVADNAPELRALVGEPAGAGAEFERLDADFVRVIEDVIDTLIVRNLINITDLPEQAQAKLFARKSLRERLSSHSLRLFEPPTSTFGDVI
jgi:hypothetical protein